MFRVLSFPCDFIHDFVIEILCAYIYGVYSSIVTRISFGESSNQQLLKLGRTNSVNLIDFNRIFSDCLAFQLTDSCNSERLCILFQGNKNITSLKTAKRRKSNQNYPSSMRPSSRRFGDKYRFVGLEDCECDEKKSGKVVCARVVEYMLIIFQMTFKRRVK